MKHSLLRFGLPRALSTSIMNKKTCVCTACFYVPVLNAQWGNCRAHYFGPT